MFRMRSEASYRSRSVEVKARVSLTVRWRAAVSARRTLAEELSIYTRPGELLDLEAMLERYEDSQTEEIRSILAAQKADRLLRAQVGGPFG